MIGVFIIMTQLEKFLIILEAFNEGINLDEKYLNDKNIDKKEFLKLRDALRVNCLIDMFNKITIEGCKFLIEYEKVIALKKIAENSVCK